MTEYDRETLDALSELIPSLTHIQKEKLLSFGEGMAFANDEFRAAIKECPKSADDPPASERCK